ncbi:hypothetical protein BO86DRAFT_385448 [Aspergillus japonicus CBS 114.51]|uniref:Uncharacterized protein n=2 Tax=Aspergillus TaxID=5052 RepID=A0A2V5H2W4_ASPV1|nr:hypothetical protein BO86DRAFT_385448 [Aspergillus japonicus CBS 114.51]PYI15994.1 hypothetical protein BO99DRAFT_435896 [Aspergillus violaceofuscus CBS 115571]RAH86646.1 hypothetical protein BO86DRAFT_385448 [Aspergillus japonicus CBS 114.51]
MATKSRVAIRFTSIDNWQEKDEEILKIIKDDTGTDGFPVVKTVPPLYLPPALSQKAIDKLKALDGISVEVIEE